MKIILYCLFLGLTYNNFAQNLGPRQLLNNAISYHDPSGTWDSFNANFTVVMRSPKAAKRRSAISIDLPSQYFSVSATQDTNTTTYTLDKGKCQMKFNGKILDSINAIEKKMSCERARLYENYYTYLYGLPMKLRDPGTLLGETVEKRTFKNKAYLVLKVSYDATVGSDVWYFYFNPKTYAMEVYQFFKTDDEGKVLPDSGEYILLSEEVLVHGIKMPKVRAWYYNTNDQYLGTDTLLDK